MPNLTIYLPKDLEEKVRKAAKSEGTNVSRWITERVARLVNESWSPEFIALAGAFPDFPEVEELRKGYGADSPREELD
jgi:hypothetical protein